MSGLDFSSWSRRAAPPQDQGPIMLPVAPTPWYMSGSWSRPYGIPQMPAQRLAPVMAEQLPAITLNPNVPDSGGANVPSLPDAMTRGQDAVVVPTQQAAPAVSLPGIGDPGQYPPDISLPSVNTSRNGAISTRSATMARDQWGYAPLPFTTPDEAGNYNPRVPDAQNLGEAPPVPQRREGGRDPAAPGTPGEVPAVGTPTGDPRLPTVTPAAIEAVRNTAAAAGGQLPRLTIEGGGAPGPAQVTLPGTTPPGGATQAARAGGGTGGWPSLDNIPLPDYGPMREAMAAAKPPGAQPLDRQAMWMSALIGALSNLNFQPGQRIGYGLVRAIPGGAAGYGNEWQTQRAQQRADEGELRGYHQRRAGMEGDIADKTYGNQVNRAGFQFQVRKAQGEESQRGAALANDATRLDLQREELGFNRQMAQLRLDLANRQLLMNLGLGGDTTSQILRVVPAIANGQIPMPPGFIITHPDVQGNIDFNALRQRVEREVKSTMSPIEIAGNASGPGARVLQERVNLALQQHILGALTRPYMTGTPEQKAAADAAVRSMIQALVRPRAGQTPGALNLEDLLGASR